MATSATSASASHSRLSVPGSATLAGLVILANPRRISKTIVFDAQLYLGPGNHDMLIGSLRYFNSDDLAFSDEPGLYVIHSTFARRCFMADVPLSGHRVLSDYSFIGDIQLLISLGRPGPRYLPNLTLSKGDEGPVNLNDLATFTIEPCVRPYIQVTGVAVECLKVEGTFEVNVEQYISCVKPGSSTSRTGGSRLRPKPTTRFFCHIPDSPKYRSWSSKPIPGNKRYVSFGGFITREDKSDNNSEVEQFLIDVETITFCGQYTQPVNSAASVSQNGSPKKSTALFSYTAAPQSPSAPPENQDGA